MAINRDTTGDQFGKLVKKVEDAMGDKELPSVLVTPDAPVVKCPACFATQPCTASACEFPRTAEALPPVHKHSANAPGTKCGAPLLGKSNVTVYDDFVSCPKCLGLATTEDPFAVSRCEHDVPFTENCKDCIAYNVARHPRPASAGERALQFARERGQASASASAVCVDCGGPVAEFKMGRVSDPCPKNMRGMPCHSVPASDQHRGLYQKYDVTRTDGSSGPGGKHVGCDYFVLDLRHDKYAFDAIQAYALACREEFPQLASDLLRRSVGERLDELSAPVDVRWVTPVDLDKARAAARRLINVAWRKLDPNTNEPLRPHFQIPANLDDDDLIVERSLDELARLRSAGGRWLLDEIEGAIGVLKTIEARSTEEHLVRKIAYARRLSLESVLRIANEEVTDSDTKSLPADEREGWTDQEPARGLKPKKTSGPSSPARWRVGNKLGRTIYFNDMIQGMLDSRVLAARVVELLNAADSPTKGVGHE